jgi:hypothetical protein
MPPIRIRTILRVHAPAPWTNSSTWLGRHMVTPTFARSHLDALHTTFGDRRLAAALRLNVLVVGDLRNVERTIAAITGLQATALPTWPHVHVASRSDTDALTVIVRDVHALDPDEQARLHDWIGEYSAVRLLATAAVPPYPLVERGEFLESLYYRLNVVYVDATCTE